jgi:glycine cleavage system H protein
MVAILAFLTFAAFIGAAWLLAREEREAAEGVPVNEALRAPPLQAGTSSGPVRSYLHPGHAWVRLGPDGMATIGASDFAAHFVGALSSVETPEMGRHLRQGEPAWTLVSSKDRRLTQAMPIDGEIVAVNPDLGRDRVGAPGAPRGSKDGDWILKVRPSRVAENIQNLLSGSLADAWQEFSGMKLNATLVPALGRVANDGGVWVEHFGDLLDDSDWLAIRRDLFPPLQGEAVR